MKKLQYLLSSIYFLMISVACAAQDTAGNNDVPQMADGLRASGKIYVVVAVVVTILAGVIIYLVQIDKKISRMEKEGKSGVGSRESGVGSREPQREAEGRRQKAEGSH
jgi:hypothetical protein